MAGGNAAACYLKGLTAPLFLMTTIQPQEIPNPSQTEVIRDIQVPYSPQGFISLYTKHQFL